MKKDFPVLYKAKEECCGCTACYSICPKEAINMVRDEEGFEYPQIDVSKCVRCFQCITVCPIKASINLKSEVSNSYMSLLKKYIQRRK